MRGEGTTTKQMLEAPHGAVFIWCNHHLDHPKFLAKKHNRTDLEIVSPGWLDYGWIGRELTGIVVDHATYLNDRQQYLLRQALPRVRTAVRVSAEQRGD